MEKTCTGCGETKSLEEYHKQKVGKYGRCARCKVCKNAYQKTYQKTYDQSEARKAYKKAYNQSEAGKAAQKKYRESEAGKAKRKATRNNRRQTDPVYKLQCNLRSGFCQWIKGNKKTCRTEQYVGCTYKELLDHLESQFEEGMTWENQGEWQIDHFKAQSCFDPTIEEEAFKCWHYTNLQPMWAPENNEYSNKKKPGDEFVIWMDREIGWVNIKDVVNV